MAPVDVKIDLDTKMKAPALASWMLRSKNKTILLFIVTVFIPAMVFLGFNNKRVRTSKTSVPSVIIPRIPNLDSAKSVGAIKNYKFNHLKQIKRLSPFALMNQRCINTDPPLTKSEINDIFQSGAGLQRYIFPNGNTSWMEHGVVYVPQNMVSNSRADLADVFSADYEPFLPYNHKLFFEWRNHSRVPYDQRKIIVAKMAGSDDVNKPSPLTACPDFPCLHTTNYKDYFDIGSAMTFNAEHLSGPTPNRRPDQIFILYIYEPLEPKWSSKPAFHNKKYNWGDAFNWTMSYHVDSDIYMPYGVIRRRPQPLVKDYKSILAKKTKLVAWMVSHCETHSQREKYVEELQKYIPVDVYGKCGPFKCAREKDIECQTNMSTTYKFYLSFENALCDDYVSEKFFKTLKMNIVPVIRGARNYYRSIPTDIFVDASDIGSPKALAERLKYLDAHDDEYIGLLRKKDQYFASYGTYPHKVGNTVWIKYNWENAPLCELCQRLWNTDKYAKVYPDIQKWFNARLCRAPTDLGHNSSAVQP